MHVLTCVCIPVCLCVQVFLLESQVTSMPQLQFDLEEDKSFVFLVYPPEHADSLNPDHITARSVPPPFLPSPICAYADSINLVPLPPPPPLSRYVLLPSPH